MTLRTVLLSLQSLLSSAEPDDPQDAVVAKQVCNSLNNNIRGTAEGYDVINLRSHHSRRYGKFCLVARGGHNFRHFSIQN